MMRLILVVAVLFAQQALLARADVSSTDSGVFTVDNRGAEVQVFQRATGVFLAGISFNNTFKAVVSNWGDSSPGAVTFRLNGESVVVPYVAGGVETSAFDMGALPAGDCAVSSVMTVAAMNDAGLGVVETSIVLKCINPPSFMFPSRLHARSLSPLHWSQDIIYEAYLGPAASDLATTWYGSNQLFTNFGGTFSGELNIEFNGASGACVLDIRTDLTSSEEKPKLGSVRKAATNVYNMSYQGEKTLTSGLSARATINSATGCFAADPTVCAGGGFGYEWKIVPIGPLFNVPGVWFTAKGGLDLGPEFCLDLTKLSPDNLLPLTAVDVDLNLTGQGGLEPGSPYFLSVFGGLEGTASGKIHVLGEPIATCDDFPHLADLNFDLSIVGYARTAFTEWDFGRFPIVQWICPTSGLMSSIVASIPEAHAGPANRPYLASGEPYAQFVAAFSMDDPKTLSGPGAGFEIDELVTSNVNLDAAPAIAGRGSVTVMVTSEDDPSNPGFVEHEIHAAFRSAGVWGNKLQITGNSVPDVLPSVGFDAAGKAIAVWTTIPGVSGVEEFGQVKSKMEIAWSTYDSGTQTWSPAVQLTSDGGSLDALPQIVNGGDGSTSVIWLNSPDNTLSVGPGEPIGNPVTVMVSRWNGSVFEAPAALLGGCDAVAGVRYARNAVGSEHLLWTRDGDNDLTTLADREIVESHTVGETWSTPQTLTANEAADSAAGLVVSSSGVLAYYVRAGTGGAPEVPQDELYARSFDGNSWSQECVQFTAPAILSPSWAVSEGSAVSCAWIGPATNARGKGIFYSTSATGLGSWAWPQEMGVNSLPTVASCAYAGTHLQVGYVSARPAAGAQELGFSLEDAASTAFDVRLIDHTPYEDLWLETSDVVVQPQPPPPAEDVTVSITAHLAGDYPDEVLISAYDGDPAAGGILIGADYVAMVPGMSTTVDFTWNYPYDANGHTVYAVLDAAGSVPEILETNNVAQVPISAINPIAVSVRHLESAQDQLAVELAIRNTGPGQAEEVMYELRGDSETGPVIASGVIPFIGAGQTSRGVVPWDVSLTAPGRYVVFLVVDPLGTILESDEADNMASGSVVVQPDLQIEPWSIRMEDGLARVVVRNTGSKPSQPTAVRATVAGQTISATPLIALSAAGWCEVTLNVSEVAFGSTISFTVNPDSNGSDEVTLLNNTDARTYTAPADFDFDNDIDSDDLALFNACALGSSVPRGTALDCRKADLDHDNDVDQDDFGIFQRCYSGQGLVPPSTCGS